MQILVSFLGFVSAAHAVASTSFDNLYDNASNGSPVVSMIQNAKKTIDIEIYEMQDSQVLAAIKSAVDRGIRVRVVQEGTPDQASCMVFEPISATNSSTCVNQKTLINYVRAHNGTYVAFNHQLCGTPGKNCFQHGKILIADSSSALISTGNFNATNLCDPTDKPSTCNRDYSFVTQDVQVISTLEAVFEIDVVEKNFDLPALLQTSAAQRVTVSPFSTTPLVNFIHSAQKTIQIENQYLNEPSLNGALIDAAKRGVKVFVMVASACSFKRLIEPIDHAEIQQWTDTFTSFDQAGIFTKIFDGNMLLNGLHGYLHAKVILVDGARAWVGSVNGSTMSLTQNREYGIFTSESQPVKLLSTLLYQDYMNKNAETWKDSLACNNDVIGKPKGTGL